MAIFECTVERIDNIRVELDSSYFTEEWMANFRRHFYDIETLEGHAKHIAQFIARNGHRFIEGYGVPLKDGKAPYWAGKDNVNHAINIVTLDEDIEVFSEEKETEA